MNTKEQESQGRQQPQHLHNRPCNPPNMSPHNHSNASWVRPFVNPPVPYNSIPVAACLAPIEGNSSLNVDLSVQTIVKSHDFNGNPISLGEICREIVEELCPSAWLLRVCGRALPGKNMEGQVVRLSYGNGFVTTVWIGTKSQTYPAPVPAGPVVEMSIGLSVSSSDAQPPVGNSFLNPRNSLYDHLTCTTRTEGNNNRGSSSARVWVQTNGPTWLCATGPHVSSLGPSRKRTWKVWGVSKEDPYTVGGLEPIFDEAPVVLLGGGGVEYATDGTGDLVAPACIPVSTLPKKLLQKAAVTNKSATKTKAVAKTSAKKIKAAAVVVVPGKVVASKAKRRLSKPSEAPKASKKARTSFGKKKAPMPTERQEETEENISESPKRKKKATAATGTKATPERTDKPSPVKKKRVLKKKTAVQKAAETETSKEVLESPSKQKSPIPTERQEETEGNISESPKRKKKASAATGTKATPEHTDKPSPVKKKRVLKKKTAVQKATETETSKEVLESPSKQKSPIPTERQEETEGNVSESPKRKKKATAATGTKATPEHTDKPSPAKRKRVLKKKTAVQKAAETETSKEVLESPSKQKSPMPTERQEETEGEAVAKTSAKKIKAAAVAVPGEVVASKAKRRLSKPSEAPKASKKPRTSFGKKKAPMPTERQEETEGNISESPKRKKKATAATGIEETPEHTEKPSPVKRKRVLKKKTAVQKATETDTSKEVLESPSKQKAASKTAVKKL